VLAEALVQIGEQPVGFVDATGRGVCACQAGEDAGVVGQQLAQAPVDRHGALRVAHRQRQQSGEAVRAQAVGGDVEHRVDLGLRVVEAALAHAQVHEVGARVHVERVEPARQQQLALGVGIGAAHEEMAAVGRVNEGVVRRQGDGAAKAALRRCPVALVLVLHRAEQRVRVGVVGLELEGAAQRLGGVLGGDRGRVVPAGGEVQPRPRHADEGLRRRRRGAQRLVEAFERRLQRLARERLAQEVLAARDQVGGASRRVVGWRFERLRRDEGNVAADRQLDAQWSGTALAAVVVLEAASQPPRLDTHDAVELGIEARCRPAEDLDRDHRLLQRGDVAALRLADQVAQQRAVPGRGAKRRARRDPRQRELDLLGGRLGDRRVELALHGRCVQVKESGVITLRDGRRVASLPPVFVGSAVGCDSTVRRRIDARQGHAMLVRKRS